MKKHLYHFHATGKKILAEGEDAHDPLEGLDLDSIPASISMSLKMMDANEGPNREVSGTFSIDNTRLNTSDLYGEAVEYMARVSDLEVDSIIIKSLNYLGTEEVDDRSE